uniref:Nectin cell adhesion molecule 3 n=1 Tax=Oryzias sinensis TaxID=183150 RepID=A0A8C7WZG8_9TELE
MAGGQRARWPASTLTNAWLLAAAVLLNTQGIIAQKVQVEVEVEAYPTESVTLRCQFINGGSTKLTQVSWIWEPVDGQRDNIAVYHPVYGQSFPNPLFKDRVAFLFNNLENPTIRISKLRMSDAGRYTCEYATYPTGNEQGTTNLVMLAKPKNSADVVTVQAGTKSVVVAQCVAADSKPAATINWISSVRGNYSTSTTSGPDGTVTVRSEYRLVPTAEDNNKEVTCMVDQRTQERQWTKSLRLSVEFPPSVSIAGYDQNWYVGRSNAELVCVFNANPPPTAITWKSASGPLPDSVVVENDRLSIRKVDDAVNTTFICEVKNKHGANSHHINVFVNEQQKTEHPKPPSTGAIIGGILGTLAVIGLIVGAILYVCCRQDDGEGPPKHKPPPPVKGSSSTEMLTKPSEPTTASKRALLSKGEVYYETSGREPVANLDDGSSGALNGGAPPGLDSSVKEFKESADSHHSNEFESSNHGAPAASISRGDSFVSPAMYV